MFFKKKEYNTSRGSNRPKVTEQNSGYSRLSGDRDRMLRRTEGMAERRLKKPYESPQVCELIKESNKILC